MYIFIMGMDQMKSDFFFPTLTGFTEDYNIPSNGVRSDDNKRVMQNSPLWSFM